MLGLTIGVIVGVAALGIISLYWRSIVEWIQRVWRKVQERVASAVEGVRTFIVKTANGYKNCTKYYSRNKITNEWQETVILKEVDESEIPFSIRRSIVNRPINIEVETTNEFAKVLQNVQ